MLETWKNDLRFAVRSLGRRPGFAAVVALTLALGIGANTAIFSVLHGTVLRPLPFPETEQLVWLSDTHPAIGDGIDLTIPNFLDLRAQSNHLEIADAYRYQGFNLAGGDRPERMLGLAVGPDFFQTLGLPPALGRDFLAEENVEGAPRVVVLSHESWVVRFESDPEVLGSTITLDGMPHTVIGVTDEAFEFPADPGFFVSMQYQGGLLEERAWRSFNAVGRLRAGSSVESADRELRANFATLVEMYPDANRDWSTSATTFKSFLLSGSGIRSMTLLMGAVSLVLLIACGNVMNLMLVRSESRQREMAVRVALGASRMRVISAFLSETLVLSAVGATAGIALAYVGVPVLVDLYDGALPRATKVSLSTPVLAFALVLSLAVGLVIGILPALRAHKRTVQGQLRDGTRAVSRGGVHLRNGLVVAEVAMAVMLVSGAGLLITSFQRLTSVDSGYEDPEQVLVLRMALSSVGYEEDATVLDFQSKLIESVNALPGVVAVGTTSQAPMNPGGSVSNLNALGNSAVEAHFVEIRTVSEGYLEAAGIQIIEGNPLEVAPGLDHVVVITETLSRQLFGGETAVGKWIEWNAPDGHLLIGGVASDTKGLGLSRRAPPRIYLPATVENAEQRTTLLVRTQGEPMSLLPQIRDLVRRSDPSLPITTAERLVDRIINSVGRARRMAMSLFALFAGLSLLLGAVGIYGVMSYSVEERTRELGVRQALGAQKSQLVSAVLRHGIGLTGVGLIVGTLGSLASGRLLASWLYGIESSDPRLHLLVAVVLLSVATMACYLPARRASGVDPASALRD